MISEDELGNVIKNWSPETDSVNILKEAFEEFGKDVWDIDNDDLLNMILNIEWSERYYDAYSSSGVSAVFSIVTIDHEGNCLYGDYNKVKHISEFLKDLNNFHREQETK